MPAPDDQIPDFEVDSFQILSLDGKKSVTFQHRKMPFMRSQKVLRSLLFGVVPGATLPDAHENPQRYCASLVMQLYVQTFDEALKAFTEFLSIKTDEDGGFGPMLGNEKKLDGIVEGVDVFLLLMHCVGYHFLPSFRARPSMGLSLLGRSDDAAAPGTKT